LIVKNVQRVNCLSSIEFDSVRLSSIRVRSHTFFAHSRRNGPSSTEFDSSSIRVRSSTTNKDKVEYLIVEHVQRAKSFDSDRVPRVRLSPVVLFKTYRVSIQSAPWGESNRVRSSAIESSNQSSSGILHRRKCAARQCVTSVSRKRCFATLLWEQTLVAPKGTGTFWDRGKSECG